MPHQLKKTFSAIFLFLGLAFCAPLFAADNPRELLNQFTKQLNTLQGEFTQNAFDMDGGLRESSNGSLSLSAPRMLRWEILKPYPQLIVADGSNVWVYDPDLEQVTVREQSVEESGSPLTVLTDPSALDRDFNVKALPPANGLQRLQLKPKSKDSSLRECILSLSEKGLVSMEFTDTMEQRTEVLFTDWKRNPKFAANYFDYTPPEGVDVVGTPSASATTSAIE